ncbi:MAG: amidase [Ectothiorhodospiraceae bacterium]
MKQSLPSIAELLSEGPGPAASAGTLLETCLQGIRDEDDGSIHTAVFETAARAEAEAVDVRRRGGVPELPLGGAPIAVKALFDVAGQVTHSGSLLLADAPPAQRDAEVIRRLRAAGAVLTGHTNMTEFAYSGLGLNPHYRTPTNPLDAARIPGGSSSGAAVAVARGMAVAGLGSDTGGSIRIPSAFCGLVGFKPTQRRIPMQGVFPLSPSLDSVGPIAGTVADCARIDAVLSGQRWEDPAPRPIEGLNLAVPTSYVLDDMDETVSRAFERALKRLRDGGARIAEVAADNLTRLPELGRGGGPVAAESYHYHREWLAESAERYDPRVSSRMLRGREISAADYLDLLRLRREQIARMDRLMADYDALVMPTVPVVPPRFAELERDEDYARINVLVLRNPTVANMLDLCAISLPCHEPGELPVGLMLVGRHGHDAGLLRCAAAVEPMVAGGSRAIR